MLAPDRRPDIRQIVLKQLDSWVQRGGLKRSIGEIEARLDRCLADCKHFNGAVCTFRGSPCRLWQRWLETLALGNCLRWQNADEEH